MGVDALVLVSVRIAQNVQRAVKIKLLNFKTQNIFYSN
ncbi:hypothetical protein EU92_2029 [Prochlorococcus marinus str. MIT 9107]|nr:hypothetical protein EU92_2029 [Prochlorococcus marinus str. MIT 9107]